MKAPSLPKLPRVPGSDLLKAAPPAPVETPRPGAPDPPPAWAGSDLEWMVAWWLTKERIPFQYQAPFLGGRERLGGQVADFVIEDRQPPLLIGVQGEYWHYADAAKRARSRLAKEVLMAQGYLVVYVRGIDLTTRLTHTMRSALNGIQLFADD